MGEKGMTSEDLYHLQSIADPRLTPNGKECVYIKTTVLKDKDDYSSNLFLLDLDRKEEKQWTHGEFRNHSPRWSFDGSRLAFISNRSGQDQIYIINHEGGEAKQITSCKTGVSNPVWSPNGLKLAFQISLCPDESLCSREEELKNHPVPLEITEMKYKSDSSGFHNNKKKQIAVMDLESSEIEIVTERDHDYTLQSWSPDGMYLALSADLNDQLDFSFISDIYLLNIKTKGLTNLTSGKGYFANPSWSPNSRYIGMFGHEREYENATVSKIWVFDLKENVFSCLTQEWNVAVGNYMVGDFIQGAVTPSLQWANDNYSFYFIISDHGNTSIYYGSLAGEMYPVLAEEQHVYGLTIEEKQEFVVAAISKPDLPSDLFKITISTGEVEQLTEINKNKLMNIKLATPEAIEFEGAERWTIKGWLMKPIGWQSGKKYPLVVEVHGGPHAMYGNTYFHEFQVLAAQGVAVLYINPRGSHGYGQAFANAVRGNYGGNDYYDIMAAVDYVLEHIDYIDEKRLGITGGSYGGFMTNWIIGQTDRFKAAVTQRSISNWISFYGVSDIGYYFTEWQIKSNLEEFEVLWKHSPIAYVKKIQTPLLILHSENDYRCPIEQAEQLFIALKRLGKETKFIRFPESNHELSRSGRPSLRIKRLDYIQNWFKDYL